MPAKHLPGLATVSEMDKDGILHLFYGSRNGWMTKSIFRDAMKRWAAWETKEDSFWNDRAKLLLMDGHAAHVDIDSIQHLQTQHMRCLFPPGASSHMWQVLDNGPFGLFRKNFSRLRIGVAGAVKTGLVVAPATVLGVGRCPQTKAVVVDLDVALPDEDAPRSIFVKLKDARKVKVHSSDTLCAGYWAWTLIDAEVAFSGGFVHTGTFRAGFDPKAPPRCDPGKIRERLKAHKGVVDLEAVVEKSVQRVADALDDGLTDALRLKIRQELAVVRVTTNTGIVDDSGKADTSARKRVNSDMRQLCARTTTSILAAGRKDAAYRRELEQAPAKLDALTDEAATKKLASDLTECLHRAQVQVKRALSTVGKADEHLDAPAEAAALRALLRHSQGLAGTPDRQLVKTGLKLDSPGTDAELIRSRTSSFSSRLVHQVTAQQEAARVASESSTTPAQRPDEAEVAEPAQSSSSGSSLAASAARRVSKRLRERLGKE